MPITITVNEAWEAMINISLFRSTPSDLNLAFEYLKKYQRVKHYAHSDEVLKCTHNIVGRIEKWAKGKKTKTVKGRWRYRSYFDRKGVVSELYRQAVQTTEQTERFQETLRANLAVRTQPTIAPVNPPAPVAPMLPPPLPPRAPDPKVHFHCYREAAEMIRMKTGQSTEADVRKSVAECAFGAGAMPRPSVMLYDLYKGLINLGHDVAYVPDCQLDHVTNMLDNTTDQSPALVCVSGSGMFNRVILCHGRVFTNAGRNQEGGYKVKDHRAQADTAILYESGDYDATINGVDEHSLLLPSLGYIKFKR